MNPMMSLAVGDAGVISAPDAADVFSVNLRTATGVDTSIPLPFTFGSDVVLSRTTGTSNVIRSMAVNGLNVVGVCDLGTIVSSTNGGLTWAARTNGFAGNGNKVVWAETLALFVAVGDGGKILTSPTGVTWTAHTSGTALDITSVAWSGSKLYVGLSNGQVLSSVDAVTWSATGATGETGSVYSIIADGLNVCIGTMLHAVRSSDGGVTWNAPVSTAGNPISLYYVSGMIWSGQGNSYYVSTDFGATWNSYALPAGFAAVSAHYKNGVFYTTMQYGSAAFLYKNTDLTDSLNWTGITGFGAAYLPNASLMLPGDEVLTYNATGNLIVSLSMTDASSGGLVISKSRSNILDWSFYDTVRGATQDLTSTSMAAQTAQTTGIKALRPKAFEIGTLAKINTAGATYADFVFKKNQKFMDIVVYSGDSAAGRAINHNLGCMPGLIIIKAYNDVGAWYSAFRRDNTYHSYAISLNSSSAASGAITSASYFTSTTFKPDGVGFSNAAGQQYVAYLFAHDDGADSTIKCGAYTGNGLVAGPIIDLGWEPQFVFLKSAGAGSWYLLDTSRGIGLGSLDQYTVANTTAAETVGDFVKLLPNGFSITTNGSEFNTSGTVYHYMAIRRSRKVPTTADEVFKPILRTGTGVATVVDPGIPVDMVLARRTNSTTDGSFKFWDRLRGKNLNIGANSSAAQVSTTTSITGFDENTGFKVGTTAPNTTAPYILNCFKRAKGFFETTYWEGLGADITVPHALGVLPELVLVKSLGSVGNWRVANNRGVGNQLVLNTTAASTDPLSAAVSYSADNLYLFSGQADTCASGVAYIAYMFATLAGISKCGTYTGNGTSLTVGCGFAAGARFILIKRLDAVGDWYVWDTARGIVAGNDGHLSLNTTIAEVTADDSVDPDASGFIVNQNATTNINVSGALYDFLAIA